VINLEKTLEITL